ncbi:PQQ-binding-like beta-propeller repeat protein [Micromonospora sp. NPDC007271]|uniref:outer membrane protein assembly factor BamB family protein n=1 Tax=Micromonospora sp. NPDC007271 TaxID=3154587 RepID=UPI0033C3DBE7
MSGVIELGELRHGDQPEPPPPRARRPPAAPARVLALCCAALLTLAGAAPAPRRPPGVSVPAPHDAHFLVVADRLIVAEWPDPTGRGGREVVGYGLPGGAPVWRFTLPDGDDVTGLWAVAGLSLVTSGPPGSDSARTTALDPRTGSIRWRQPGYPVPTQAGGVLVEQPGRTDTIRAVDPGSGTVRWSMPFPDSGMVYGFGDRGVTAAVLLTDDGRVEVYDVDTGALRRAGRLPPTDGRAPYRLTQVVGDLLLVDASGTVTAYGLDRLDRRWTLPVRRDGATWFADCAEVICRRDQASGLRTYDPVTGRLRWSDDHWTDARRVGDRLLAVAPAGGPAVELAVLDPGAGRALAGLGRWRLADVDRNGSRLLGFRPVVGGRTLVAELDVSAAQVRYRAVLPGSWGDCVAADAALVCRSPAGGLMVWPDGR